MALRDSTSVRVGFLSDPEKLRIELYQSIKSPGLNPQNTFLLLAKLIEQEYGGDLEQDGKRFEVFVEDKPPGGLGMNADQLTKIILDFKHPHEIPPHEDDKVIERMAWMRHRVKQLLLAAHRTLPSHEYGTGKPGPGRGKTGDKITRLERGTSAPYLIARLKRDAPSIAERLGAGEFKSVRSAAIEAGIVKSTSRLEKLRREWRLASEEERRAFLKEIG